MKFERYCGLASAAAIILIVTLNTWLGIWGPLWRSIQGSDILTAVIAIIGWTVTILLGVHAFRLSQQQIALAQTQIEQQQRQIDRTQEELRGINYARLHRKFEQLARNVDLLITAQGYLGTFSARFPTGNIDGWARALVFARNDAADFISESAITAPFGHGQRVSTVMNRLQRLGDLLNEKGRGYMPDQGTLQYYDPIVKAAIEGIRTVEAQIADAVPTHQVQLQAIADERDMYASRN